MHLNVYSLSDHQPECNYNNESRDDESERAVSGPYLVFDAEQARHLRQEPYRICGRLIGSQHASSTSGGGSDLSTVAAAPTAAPAAATATTTAAMATTACVPLQLTADEVCLLAERCLQQSSSSSSSGAFTMSILHNVCAPITPLSSWSSDDEQPPQQTTSSRLDAFKAHYERYAGELAQRQRAALRHARTDQLRQMRAKIVGGKRRKLTAQLAALEARASSNAAANNDNNHHDHIAQQRSALLEQLARVDADFDEQLSRASASADTEISADCLSTELFVQTPSLLVQQHQQQQQQDGGLFTERSLDLERFMLSRRATATTTSCRYRTFRHLWSLGYYLTCGSKFGGDFLVYPGDPAAYHAQFVLVCVEEPATYAALGLKQLVAYARMATSVKKTFLLAHCVSTTADSDGDGDDGDNGAITTLTSPSPPPPPTPTLPPGTGTIVLDNGRTHLRLLSISWSHM